MMSEDEYFTSLRFIFSKVPDIVEQYRDQELQALFAMVCELQSKMDGFDTAFAAIRDEVKVRRDMGDVRTMDLNE